MLVPVDAERRPEAIEVIEEIRLTRKGRSRGGVRIRELIDEGRRY
jgi:hypothetical protein